MRECEHPCKTRHACHTSSCTANRLPINRLLIPEVGNLSVNTRSKSTGTDLCAHHTRNMSQTFQHHCIERRSDLRLLRHVTLGYLQRMNLWDFFLQRSVYCPVPLYQAYNKLHLSLNNMNSISRACNAARFCWNACSLQKGGAWCWDLGSAYSCP